MKIVLKDADFSESGIPVPYEVQLTGGKTVNFKTGNIQDGASDRSVDLHPIKKSYNKLTLNSQNAVLYSIYFYSGATPSPSNYIGYASSNGENPTLAVGHGESVRIDQFAHYLDGSGQETSISTAVCWILAVTAAPTGIEMVVEKV